MEAQTSGGLRRWAKRLTVGLISGALLATSASLAVADPTPAPTPTLGAAAPAAAVGNVTISMPTAQYVGVKSYATGRVSGFTGQVTVKAQVYVDGAWKSGTPVTVAEGGAYKLLLSTGTHTKGSWKWRVTASDAAGTTATTDTHTIKRVATPRVTASTTRYRAVGSTVKLTGKLKGFLPGKVTIESQVRVNGAWKTLSKSTTSSTSYSISAQYRTGTLATNKFRVRATQSPTTVGSDSVKVTRVPKKSASINKDRVKLLGASTYATGTVKGYSGKVTVAAQVRSHGKWVTKAKKTVSAKYNGTKYSLPLTYREDHTGTVKWRVLVTQGSSRTGSSSMKITRTLKGIDSRCLTGRVLCISKDDHKLRWMIDGKIVTTLDARFGASSSPTRNGSFTVFRKSRDHVSSIYGSSMPFAMFFSGGQAVHYSADFAARGYAGASHGCVNIRDYAAIKALFDKVRLGDKVVVYN
ncbi:L,D-transpeptidase [Tessaracoccus palaemonis]|nr:L,D-transpeptidase [Tessaracoccus palaemonis]